jgi:hypothetical protein
MVHPFRFVFDLFSQFFYFLYSMRVHRCFFVLVGSGLTGCGRERVEPMRVGKGLILSAQAEALRAVLRDSYPGTCELMRSIIGSEEAAGDALIELVDKDALEQYEYPLSVYLVMGLHDSDRVKTTLRSGGAEIYRNCSNE